MARRLHRRSVLTQLVLAAAGTALVPMAWRPAVALSVDENATRERLYLGACESRAAHEQRIEELVARLEARMDSVAPEAHAQNVERVKATSCPICGCQLGAIQPYPARF